MVVRIRPARRSDAPALIKLHERTLLDGAPPTPDVARFVRSFYETVLFDNPWAAPDLPSLVCEGADGAVAAFVGVLPRPMVLRERAVRVALLTRVMADPDHPDAAIGVATLFRHALRGPQDLSMADVVNEPGRRLWEASRAVLVTSGSLWWSHVAVEAPAPVPAGRPMGVAELLAAIDECARRFALRPVYDESTLTWLLTHLRGATHRGELQVRATDGGGWYVAYTNPDGFNGVQQIGARPGGAPAVLADLLAHTARSGGSADTRGRVDVGMAAALRDRRCALELGPWTYAHSTDRDLLLALAGGQAFLTRMEGEY